MQYYSYLLRDDYNKKVRLGETDRFCYTEKQLKKLYPNGGYTVVGETLGKKPKENKQNGKQKKEQKEPIAKLSMGVSESDVYEVGTFGKVSHKRAGYFAVGPDEYLCVCENRMPFLILTFSMGSGSAVILALLLFLLFNPNVKPPVNPLPPDDPNIITPDKDNTDKVQSEEGGGSLSMIYTLDAKMKLSTGSITIYFINPNASNHDVVIEMYIISGDKEYKVAQSGKIPAGKGLTKLTFESDEITLQEGKYKAVYRLACYNPETGERALVMPEIADVTLTVTK